MLPLVDDVQLVPLPWFPEDNGNLVVVEGTKHVPFAIVRVFAVRAPAGAVRGQHAHKACTQFLTCLHGCIKVRCDDGFTKLNYILNQPDKGLLVPPGIWMECFYQTSDSVLVVLCDRPYEPHDYIRDHNEFKAYRGYK